MGRLFGTDGIRGIANKELMPELAFNIGRAGAYVLSEEAHHKPKILVGKDTRLSGDMLEYALVAGLCSVGAEVELVGVIPTPAIAFLTRHYNADAGVMISASHNPYEYNGIKFFNNKGLKLPNRVEDRIEAIILTNSEQIPSASEKEIGRVRIMEKALYDYEQFLKSTTSCNFKGIKVALDCSNGSAYKIAPQVFKELGAEVKVINNKPDGFNINDKCGSTYIDGLKKFVVDNNMDIGFAFDGDADRVLVIDEKGEFIDGDKIMAICGKYLKEKGKLNNDTIVATVMSNIGFDIFAKKGGIKIHKTKVGDRYVLEKMLEGGFSLGGEQSGHIIFLDYNTTGDGILTALQLLSVICLSGEKLSDIASIMQTYPQVLINAKVDATKKNDYMKDKIISSMVGALESEFKSEGRVLIRASGTEHLVRVMIEGKDIDYIERKAQELADIIEQRLG